VDESHREGAERLRSLIERRPRDPSLFRAALLSIPSVARDACVDWAFGLGALPEDGPALPRGCVPYLPCSVDALLRLVDHAPVRASDRFVDVGSGVGRAAALVHLLTGAPAVGIEVQPALVAAARELAARLDLPGVTFTEGDAGRPAGALTVGSVFLLYCPFSGDHLVQLLASLASIASTRAIRVCCVDLPLPPCPWLAQAPPVGGTDLAIYRSTLPVDGDQLGAT
jgi:SAM-dependent methyltransferase